MCASDDQYDPMECVASEWGSDIFHLKDQLVKNENFVLNLGIFCRLAHQSPESVFSLPPASSFPFVDNTNSVVVEDSRSSFHRRNSSLEENKWIVAAREIIDRYLLSLYYNLFFLDKKMLFKKLVCY